jgi:probable HAF family extracellular repeat protein
MLKISDPLSLAIIAVNLFLFSSSATSSGSIQNLGALNGGNRTFVSGISSNGLVAAGFANNGAVANRQEAFRWTAETGLVSLGLLNGGTVSNANAVNADGSVIVGAARDGANLNRFRAFRWTPAGMVSLGILNGGLSSVANGVNANGNIVVGSATNGAAANRPEAFRWAQETGIVSLGLLNGGVTSEALGISADGTTIVGRANDGANGQLLTAFRWTQSLGQLVSLGMLPGYSTSLARAASSNGAVIVGSATDGVAPQSSLAFMWTENGGMVSLGRLPGGNISVARGLSADGSVIVGQADNSNGDVRATRWTAATGWQTVEAWLAAGGATIPPGTPATFLALGVSADGTVLVGNFEDGFAFIARVSPIGTGLVSVSDLYESLNSVALAPNLGLETGKLILNGIHGHPLDNRIREGNHGVWVGGDWGYFKNTTNSQRGPIGVAEIGYAHSFFDCFQAGVGIGESASAQNFNSNSKISSRGTYFIAEAIAELPYQLWGTITGYYLFGRENINRGYNGATASSSYAKPTLTTPGIRARLDWENAAQLAKVCLSPYADLGYVSSKINAYTENNGSFPATFNGRRAEATEARVGLNGALPVGCVDYVATLEGVHRFQSRGVVSNGQLLGLFDFNLAGQKMQQNWLRGAVGLKLQLAAGVLSLYLNGATKGQDPRAWAAVNYNLSF